MSGANIESMGIKALKKLITSKGLSTHGCIDKADLKARARAALAAAAEPAPSAPPAPAAAAAGKRKVSASAEGKPSGKQAKPVDVETTVPSKEGEDGAGAQGGRTWVTLAFHCGSGMVEEVSLFEALGDLDFFKGKEAYGIAPKSYEDNDGNPLQLPLLSLEEAKAFVTPLLSHTIYDDVGEAEKVVEKYVDDVKRMFEADQAKQKIVEQVGLIVLRIAGDYPAEKMPLVVRASDAAPLREFIGKAEGDAWFFDSADPAGRSMGFYTRKELDDNAEDMEERFDVATKDGSDDESEEGRDEEDKDGDGDEDGDSDEDEIGGSRLQLQPALVNPCLSSSSGELDAGVVEKRAGVPGVLGNFDFDDYEDY